MSSQHRNNAQMLRTRSTNKQCQLIGQISQAIDQEQQIFLRTDVNKLFQNMMISSNFNFKKYQQNKEHQAKNSSKKHSIQLNYQSNAFENKSKQIFTEASEINNKIPKINQKNQTSYHWNSNKDVTKQYLKTDNLNKLLKKKDSLSFANSNKEVLASKSMKANIPASSTYLSEKKQETDSQFISTKYPQSGKAKNLRRKMMSLASKGNRAIRVNTQSVHDSQTYIVKHKNIGKRIQTDIQAEQNIQKKNNYKQLQKKYNKNGPLKFRHVQNWLNNIIQEYCHDEYFDTSLTSAALKKYYIDSNSLMSNGVDPLDVSRIYNSLFVYSIGFNNLIKQISKGNRELVKNIWKVYSLLLQYCAAGNYQTLVGQIQRDKLRRVQELKIEIQKRQQIIEKNQELNEQKNMTMYKQLKRLKDQNVNLANQRQILMQDFQQADQAFNEQVSLRLKFQNTINEIYGVHKQLQNKHGRLFHDFQVKIQELKRSSQKYFEQAKTSQKYKYELIDLKQKWNELMKINNHDKQHIEVLLSDLNKMKENYFLTLKQLQQTKYFNVEKERKLEQMQTELENTKIILELREKSAKQTHTQYQITLEQNNKLFTVISQQRLQMQGLLKQKKQFNQNVLKILADSTYYKKKHQSAQIQIKNLTQKLLLAESNLHKVQVQSDIFVKQLQTYKNDLANNYSSIRNMHAKNFQLQEELSFLRKFEGNMDVVLQEKNSMILMLKDKVDDLQKKLMQQTYEFMNLESKHKILETQFKAQKQLNLRRIDEFKKQAQQMYTNESSLSKLLKTTNNELDKYKNLFNNTLMDLKNEKFERSNLTLTYEQILKVLQKKNAEQKQMAIKINQLQQQVLQYKQKYKFTYLNLINTTQQLNLKISHHKQTICHQQQIIRHRAHHYHPMNYEDLYHLYNRQIQSHDRTRDNFVKRVNVLMKQKIQIQKQNKIQKGKLQYEIIRLQKQYNKQKQILKQQIQYMKQQTNKNKKRLMTLQQLQITYKQKVKMYQYRQADDLRQNQLIQQIKQKNQKINSLYQEIQKIHDLKRYQIQNLQLKIKQIQQSKLNFIHQFKIKLQREIQQQLNLKYLDKISNIKLQYQHKIKTARFISNSSKHKSNSNNSIQNYQDFQSYFKDLVKQKTLEQLLKIKKQQFQSLNQTQNNKFYDEIEQFFKKSTNPQNIQLFNRTNYFSSSKGTTQKDFAKSLYKNSIQKSPKYLQRIQNASQDIKKRVSMSRKLRNAYNYYNKN